MIIKKETLLYDLCQWLVEEGLAHQYTSNNKSLTSWDCIENVFSTKPDNLICVTERKSSSSFGYDISGGVQLRAVEFISRSKTLETAMIKMQRIYNTIELNNRKLWLNNGNRFAMVIPKGVPYKSGQDANRRYEVSLFCEVSTVYEIREVEC